MMPEAAFHFARPELLWLALLLLPVLAWLHFSQTLLSGSLISRYADQHLLPHLTGQPKTETKLQLWRFGKWALLWLLLVFSIAGPRWDYTDTATFTPGSDLVILLDISRSMDVSDVEPSRLGRARQEVEDLIRLNRELRIGLIAFASVAHVISPITEDTQTILNALPGISSNLTRLHGSRLKAALERAKQLLVEQPAGGGRSILLISDGDFDEPGLLQQARDLSDDGIPLHVLAVGTPAGGAIPAGVDFGNLLRDKDGTIVRSKLNEALLKQLAEAGTGYYQLADYLDLDSRNILALGRLEAASAIATEETSKVWNERFYLALIPMLLILLTYFRRSSNKKGAA